MPLIFRPSSLIAALLGVSALFQSPAAVFAAVPPTPLLPPDASAFAPAIYVENKADARVEVVPVSGQPFTEALRLTTVKPGPQTWHIGANAKTTAPVRKGDVLWVNFHARRIESRQETGEAVAEVTFMQKNEAGREVRPLERGFSCGLDWVETSVPFVAEHDSPAGAATLAIRFGGAIQSLEVGGVRLLNYGPGVDPGSLARTVTRYEGHAPDAPWRAAAAARIEKIRKGDLAIRVVDAAGSPVAGAEVSVRMRRHAFAWGTAIDAKRLVTGDSPDAVRYRETIEKYFTKVVFENDLKWARWLRASPADRENILKALDWLDARDIPVRGHVMVWPSWRQTPPFLRELEKDPAALRAAITGHIAELTGLYGKRLADWDVINETYAHNDIVKLLGRDVMLDWIRAAHAGAPDVDLYYNDYVMFHGVSPESPSQYFYDLAKHFKASGIPLHGIGEQAHFGANPPGPAQIIATLDRFGAIGFPIQITEFDISTDDEQLQADFTRDFTIAVFSHPSVNAFVQWGFWAGAHWKPEAALWAKDWSLRPNGQAWIDLVTKEWWTNADGRTGPDGAYATRGFYGDYEITVTHAGTSRVERLKLQPGAAVHTVTFP
ncbi:MAG: endo-1,4-beta-xylanase [Burkholderiales bacterium]|nr:endo-1,4-beta-xylanase [Opitutaceae bacterium]